MRTLTLALLAALVSTPALSATENDPADARVPEVVPQVVTDAASQSEATMQLGEVSLEERTVVSDDAAAAQLGERGGFWWIVGVIVIAGVILAVVL